VKISIESATVLLPQSLIQPVAELGKPLFFEPEPAH
jgi:hypothetical protein